MAKKNGSTVATQAPQPSSNWKALKQALKPASASPPSAKRKRTSATTTVTTTTTVVETPKLALEKGKGKQRESEHGDDDARSKGKKEIPVDEILSGGTAAWQAEPGQYLAIDCEMVGVGPEGSESTLARVSIVNYHGVVMLDRFVRQRELVTDYRTWVSGIREEDLRNAPTFAEVQKEVAELIKGRILIGHAISNDTQVLLLSHPWTMTRDTAKYPPLQGLARTKKPGLKTLAKLCLGVDIQAGEHSSVDDARATMAIYRSQKTAWEDSLRVHSKPSLVTTSTPALQNLDLSNISITGVKKSHKPKSLGLAATMRSLRAEREKEAEENGEVGMGEVEAELRDQRKRAREEEDDMVVGFDFAPKAKAVKMAEVEREVVKKEGEKKKAKKATGKSFKGDKEKRPASKAGWWEEETYDSSLALVTEAMKAASLESDKAVTRRPDFGQSGRPYPVRVNAFQVETSDLICHHYDVKILPDTPATPPRLNRQIWSYLDRELNIFEGVAVAYDGRAMAYSPKALPAPEGKWEINLPEDDAGPTTKTRQFTIIIKFTREINISRLGEFVRSNGGPGSPTASDVQSATQALNVLVQHGPSMLYPNRAASFFLPPEDKNAAAIMKGLEMWRGFYTSLRTGPGKLFINVDIASQPMYQSGNLPDLILNFLQAGFRGLTFNQMGASTIPPRAYIELDRFVKGLKIQLKCPGADGTFQVRKIKHIEQSAANVFSFQDDAGQRVTIEQYFKQHYGVTLQRPDFPCVAISKTGRWPIEVCEVQVGQKYSRKLDPDQTAAAIKLTTVGPRDRVDVLRTGLKRIQPQSQGIENIFPSNNASALGQWGVKIHTELMEVRARQLPPPAVHFSQRPAQIRDGVWDQRGHSFHRAAKIDRWLVFVFDSDRFFRLEEAQSAIMGLVAACKSAGIKFGDERPEINYVPRGCDISNYILQEGKKMVDKTGAPPQLLICFLPRKPCDEYGTIKRFGDVDKGVATQCLFINKAKKGNNQYYGNIALKINVKLAGINSVLDNVNLGPIAEKPTIVFGGDVTHPAPGSLSPSVSACVASMDAKCTQYGTDMRVEVIQHLQPMVEKLLRQFKTKLGLLPERIIFFRDGVSEGQFPTVLATEVASIRAAAKEIDPKYTPQVTFIVVGKRHHMSFFPLNPADADPRNGNVKAGTTVDCDITSPFQFDWYTQSHASLLGTGRSAHYTVIADDSGFSADTLQQLVFSLTFTYARCTRSVSYATPAYYADRVCTRAQLLLKRDDDDSSTHISSHSAGSSEEKIRAGQLAEYTSRLKSIHENHKDSLYFM